MDAAMGRSRISPWGRSYFQGVERGLEPSSQSLRQAPASASAKTTPNEATMFGILELKMLGNQSGRVWQSLRRARCIISQYMYSMSGYLPGFGKKKNL